MVLDHPMVRLGHERLKNDRCKVRVIEGSQKVTQVVQQSADNVFFVMPVAIGKRSGLQRVGKAVHGKAAEVARHQLHVRHDPIGQSGDVIVVMRHQGAPVFGRGMAEVRKRGLVVSDHDAFRKDSGLGCCPAAFTASMK